MRKLSAGGGWPAIWYSLGKARAAGGFWRFYRALRSKNACKTCALGMGGQRGGMVNERGRFPEVCKKSIQAMAADMQGAIRPHFFDDFTLEQLQRFTPRELEHAGRITTPLYAGPLDRNYKTIDWKDALDRVAAKLRATPPDESFFYFSGRSSNEAGFLLQLFARVYGTNNVNNCSYYCHQASGVGLSSVTGSGTATVTLDDLEHADLVFLIGGNPASNHPRLMRTLVELKRRGGRVIVINPLRELGLVRFKVPSDWRSLLFGSTIADLFVQPHIGGDIALLLAITKRLIELDAIDRAFIANAVEGWDAFEAGLSRFSIDELIERSGVPAEEIEKIADWYRSSKRTIFCWAMGITHHEHGVENVQAIANLAMARGMLGRSGCGLLPLRGHSNVQGMGSIGATPALKEAVFERLEQEFGVRLPQNPGLDTLACMERAASNQIRFAWCLGGNLYGSNPDSGFAAHAMSRIDTVVYLSTTLNTGHAWGRGRETLVLPVLARDEEPESTTQESMFNYVRLSDGGAARHEGPRSEVEVIASIAERVLGDGSPVDWASMRRHRRIRDAIAKIIPGYEAIGQVDETKREFQIDGRTFHEPRFNTKSSRARAHVIDPPPLRGDGPNELRVMTVRSEGQFNTVVYEEHDLYRGQDRRDVIMMNADDIARFGFKPEQRVTVRSAIGALRGMIVRPIDVRAGNAVMYYPEANALVPKDVDDQSRTPAFKSIVVTLEPEGAPELAGAPA
ncbi:MAG: FdhF/YdeP family oxidoreductase [Phycisphaerales bacterium]